MKGDTRYYYVRYHHPIGYPYAYCSLVETLNNEMKECKVVGICREESPFEDLICWRFLVKVNDNDEFLGEIFRHRPTEDFMTILPA